MAAIVLSLTLSVIVASLFWLAAGSRLRLNPDESQNEILNVLVYVGVCFPFLFAVVFLLLEKL